MIFSARTVHFATVERPENECVVLEEEDHLIRMAYVRCPGLTHEDVLQRSLRWLGLRELPQSMPPGKVSTPLGRLGCLERRSHYGRLDLLDSARALRIGVSA
ncbi:MAG: hypothetical protein KatS3mg104_0759 [Phycisphaerae bacterium]|nr:MAG: hypothetical protein KatS3mg104_0759 [Phycisphaerae bacterium]